MVHIKDAEFNPTGRQRVYGGLQGWINRARRFRSSGDGQFEFGAVFFCLSAIEFEEWAVVECGCCLKHSEDDACESVEFVRNHIIRVTEKPLMISLAAVPTTKKASTCSRIWAAMRLG